MWYELYTLSSFSRIAYVIHNPFTGTAAIMQCNCVSCMKTALRDMAEYVASVIKRWSLKWRHNQHDSFSNYQPYDCLFNRLFQAPRRWNLCVELTGGRYISSTLPFFKFMMTSPNGNIFRVTDPLCGEFTGDRWSPRTKAIDAELWYFLWSTPEWTVE